MKRNKTSELIIQTTKELLKKNGNITIKDIADEAYVNVAAVNYYFGNKEKLISIVIEDVIGELQEKIITAIIEYDPKETHFEEILSDMVDLIFTFVDENAGIIIYSFFQFGNHEESSNVLLQKFLLDQQFVQLVINKISEVTEVTDVNELYSKYLLFFSAFSIPLFIDIILDKENIDDKLQSNSLNYDELKQAYINNLKKLVL